MSREILGIFLLLDVCGYSQTVVGSGYTSPAPVSAAPGQIATFLVSGLGILGPIDAPAGPLPPVLGGVSATLHQGRDLAVPIQSIRPVPLCPGSTTAPSGGCATLTAVTVEIPYELIPACTQPVCPQIALPATLSIALNGQAGPGIALNPVADQVHVLTACDIAVAGAPRPANSSGLPCAPLVTHADGSIVTPSSPAAVGEALTAWVVGLGQTSPAAVTGQPGKAAPTVATFDLNYDYRVNALPVKPFRGSPDRIPPQPLFAGSAPGFAGLYQVNFTVPQDPANGTPRCPLTGTFAAGPNVAQSNLTVSIGGQSSFDGAGICVVTRLPVD